MFSRCFSIGAMALSGSISGLSLLVMAVIMPRFSNWGHSCSQNMRTRSSSILCTNALRQFLSRRSLSMSDSVESRLVSRLTMKKFRACCIFTPSGASKRSSKKFRRSTLICSFSSFAPPCAIGLIAIGCSKSPAFRYTTSTIRSLGMRGSIPSRINDPCGSIMQTPSPCSIRCIAE